MLTIPQYIIFILVSTTSISSSFVDDPAFGHTNMRVAQICLIYHATQIVLYNCTAPVNICH